MVGNLDIEGVSVFEGEAEAPLVVDTDTQLAGPTAGKRFESIGGKRRQVFNSLGVVENPQPFLRLTLDDLERLDTLASGEIGGLAVTKGSDHGPGYLAPNTTRILACCEAVELPLRAGHSHRLARGTPRRVGWMKTRIQADRLVGARPRDGARLPRRQPARAARYLAASPGSPAERGSLPEGIFRWLILGLGLLLVQQVQVARA